jgi:hypothetical protein
MYHPIEQQVVDLERRGEVFAFSCREAQRESEDNDTMNESQWTYFGIMTVMMIDDDRKQNTACTGTQY